MGYVFWRQTEGWSFWKNIFCAGWAVGDFDSLSPEGRASAEL